MEAIVFPGGRTSQLVTVSDPVEVPDGHVVVAIHGSGICGTDLHRYRHSIEERGDSAHFHTGHEAVGLVADDALNPTRRRVVVHQAWGCLLPEGPCPEAKDSRSKRCNHTAVMGLNTHGANATYQVVPSDRLLDLPDDLSWEDAVLLACNFGTAWAACRASDIQPGAEVLVTGLGPVGLLAAMIAQHRGARVTGLDISPYRLGWAKSLGLEVVDGFNHSSDSRGYDRIIETTGAVAVTEHLVAQVAPKGTICLLGLGPAESAGAFRELIFKEARLVGSLIFDVDDWDAIVADYQAMGALPRSVISHRVSPEQVPEIYELADRGETAKVVFDWTGR